MKWINIMLFVCICLFISNAVFSQCDPAEILDWHVTTPWADTVTDQTYQIEIDFPEQAESYSLLVYSEYGLFGSDVPPQIHVHQEDEVGPGLSIIEVTIPADSINVLAPSPFWHYFSVDVQVNCTGGDTSEPERFYLSSYSLLNDPGFECEEHFFDAMLPIPEQGEVTFEAYVPEDTTSNDTIETLSVFIDIGHTYIQDIQITLESPSGTVVELVDVTNNFGSTHSLSVLFLDDAPEIEAFEEAILAGPRGMYSPADPLSTFNGESAQGLWKITIEDFFGFDDGILAGLCLSINGSPCIAEITGTSYYDLNDNDIMDEGEVPHSIPFVSNSVDGSLISGNSLGEYTECTVAGAGVLELVNTPPYYATSEINFSIEQDEVLSDLDFPLQAIPGYQDLEMDLFATTPNVPGFSNNYYAEYSNVGTECIDDTEVVINFPENMTVTDVSEPGAVNDGQTVTFSPGTMCPLESGSFTMEVLLSDTTQMGTQLEVYAAIEPMLTDETPYNNEVIFESTVVASYDPNDKLVDRSSVGSTFMENDEPLKYTVRFQNTGTYLAQNVVITDTLDAQLEKTSFQLLETSHDVEVSFEEDVVFFTFNDIMLPDSTTDLEGSQGFIRFSMKPENSFSPGDIIENQADIYFDFNPPIITNTAITEYTINVGQGESEVIAHAFPNPVNEQLHIQWPQAVRIRQVEVFNALGQPISAHPVQSDSRVTINSSRWTSGIYFLRFRGDDQVKPLRVVKQ